MLKSGLNNWARYTFNLLRILGLKGKPVAIGALERFVSDWEIRNTKSETCLPAGRIRNKSQNSNNKLQKVAVVGSGPAGASGGSGLPHCGHCSDGSVFIPHT